MNKPLVYCGRATYKLAIAVTEQLEVDLGELVIEDFADHEPYYRVPNPQKIKDRNAFVVQSTSEYAPKTYFDLFGIMDAIKRQDPKKLVVVMPFMGFRRQERACEPGEAVMAELMARLIVEAGATEVVLCDPHAEETKDYFKVPVHIIDANETFAGGLKGKDLSEYFVVTPDVGRRNSAYHLAELLDLPLVEAGKCRTGHDQVGSIQIKVEDMDKTSGKTAIIREDEISTAGTILETNEALRKAGTVKAIIMATHGVLAGGAIQKLKVSGFIEKIYISDSIYLSWEKRFPKIHVVSLAPAIVQQIQQIHEA